MGIVHEEILSEDQTIMLSIIEREKGEMRDPWKMISIDLDTDGENLTPRQLREIGKFLIREGKRIGKEYKSNGKPKEVCYKNGGPCRYRCGLCRESC